MPTLLVHVVDASNPKRREQMNTVYKTLAELGADKKPIVTVYNKIDKDDIEMPLTKVIELWKLWLFQLVQALVCQK